MQTKEFHELAKKLEESGHYDTTADAFKLAINKNIEILKEKDLSEDEYLSTLLTITFKEAYKASFLSALGLVKGIDDDIMPKN